MKYIKTFLFALVWQWCMPCMYMTCNLGGAWYFLCYSKKKYELNSNEALYMNIL